MLTSDIIQEFWSKIAHYPTTSGHNNFGNLYLESNLKISPRSSAFLVRLEWLGFFGCFEWWLN